MNLKSPALVGEEPPQAVQLAREGAQPDLGGRRRRRRKFLRIQLLDDLVGRRRFRVAAEEHVATGEEVRLVVGAQVREWIPVLKG